MRGLVCASATPAQGWVTSSTSISPSLSTAIRPSSACSSWCRPSTASEAGSRRDGTPGAPGGDGSALRCRRGGGRCAAVSSHAHLRRHRIDRQAKGALFGSLERTDAHHLPCDLLAPIIADRDDDEVL